MRKMVAYILVMELIRYMMDFTIYITSTISSLYDGSYGWHGGFVRSYSFRIYVEKNDSVTTVAFAFAFIYDCELI
jgi:hypothetical protein